MKQETLHIPEKKLVGITVRTSYENEINPDKAKIGPCVGRYFQEKIGSKIPHLKEIPAILCAYTEYEDGYKGAYTYFMGQEVSEIGTLPAGLASLIIPAQTYVKFTTEPGPMPQIIIDAWTYIWQLSPAALGGTRSWKVDFEQYDERAQNLEAAVIDLYVGIEA